MSDEITLTLPRERPFYGVAHLVVGGLAVRLDLTFEHLQDLELALEGLLDRPDGGDDVTVTVRVDGETLHASVGPFRDESLRGELQGDAGPELGLRRVLDTVVDRVDVNERDGSQWVELTKNLGAVGG